jgi:hypothetical protein
MNMSGAVGDERRRRVANVVHDDGDDHYDEELDPPAANGGVVVVVVGGGGGDIDDDDAPPSESSSLIAPPPPSSSHEGDLCRRLHPPRVDARRQRRRHDRDDDDASRGSIPVCLIGGTTTMMLMILSSLALLFLLFGTDDVVVPPPRSMSSSSSSLRVVEEDPRIVVVVRDDPPSPPLLSSAEKRGDAIFTPDMIADDTAAGREYVGARVEVPEARRRCKYVVDAIKARNSNEEGGVAADNKVLGDKYRAQSADYNVFYRATAILFWKDFGSGHWGRDQNRSIDLDDLVSLRDATYEDGITPVSPMSAWTWTTGDQHLSNFGAWRNRGGEVVFSVNDFDEAAIYDFHVDVLRVAVSICNHGRSNGFGDGEQREALEAFTFTYVDTVSECGTLLPLPGHRVR